MKKIFVVCMVLILAGCSNEDLKKELASLKNQNEALTSEKAGIQQKLTEADGELSSLRTSAANAEQIAEELQTTKTALSEAETKLKSTADYDALKKKLSEVGKGTEQLAFLSEKMKGLKATIVTSQGDIELKFFPELAPLHCFNFITRAESGYYDKTQFHRVIPGFMIQGGDPNTKDMNFMDDGGGSPMVMIPHEFNSKHHSRGILSMARQSNPRLGAGSQFFVMHGDSPQLDNQYTVFGEVTSGLEVVDKITAVKRNRRDHPLEPVWVETIKIQR